MMAKTYFYSEYDVATYMTALVSHKLYLPSQGRSYWYLGDFVSIAMADRP